MQGLDDGHVGRPAAGALAAAEVGGELRLARPDARRREACALERDEAVAAEGHDLVEERLDARALVDRDGDDRQVLGERQQPVGVQVVLDPEARDAAQDEARAQAVARVEVGERVGQEAVAGAVALAEVGRELERVAHSAPPSWSPSHTQARPSARLTSRLASPSARRPSSPSRWDSSVHVLNVV